MIGILIIIGLCIFAYRQYSEAAFEFHKSNVGFGFAGIGFFFACYFAFALIIGFIVALLMPEVLLNFGGMIVFEIIAYIVGILGALWILQAFKKSWRRERDDKQLLDE